jgi:Protein of unknown function DUF262
MSNFYTDDHRTLSDLLSAASATAGATLLIPDLQRPYVWKPTQVIRLVDSLLRGWPFGSLLLWAVNRDGLARMPHRPFSMLVDKVDEFLEKGVPERQEPATYEMVLDGQQRVQSLLLAFGGDSWGFKKLDREWHEEVKEKRPRGPRGKRHWSIGELCLDLARFQEELTARSGKLRDVDFTTGVLSWVVRSSVGQRSNLPRPQSYEAPLPAADEPKNVGRFIRLGRLWERTADSSLVEGADFEDAARTILEEHQVTSPRAKVVQRPLEDLLRKLKELRGLRVTSLKVSSYQNTMGTTDAYMNAVVNIFTRLNSAGRTLTQEEITFAWVKTFWDSSTTADQSAATCFRDLQDKLGECGLKLGLDDLMSGVAFIWAVTQNAGKVLSQGDLLVESKVKPLAKQVSETWLALSASIMSTTEFILQKRGVQPRHFLSFNALAVLWAWGYVADEWATARRLTEMPRDSWKKGAESALADFGERWLIGSQWAGRWGTGSTRYVAECASALADLKKTLSNETDRLAAAKLMSYELEKLARGIEADAHDYIDRLQVEDREQVRAYHTPLWIWHRLEADRWAKSAVPLRLGRKLPELDVDHAVAVKLWETLWASHPLEPVTGKKQEDRDQALQAVNQIGNCILLETGFNISKGKKPLAAWLEEVHEFKDGQLTEKGWASALSLDPALLRPEPPTTPEQVAEAISKRTAAIRAEVKDFISGKRSRVDTVG